MYTLKQTISSPLPPHTEKKRLPFKKKKKQNPENYTAGSIFLSGWDKVCIYKQFPEAPRGSSNLYSLRSQWARGERRTVSFSELHGNFIELHKESLAGFYDDKDFQAWVPFWLFFLIKSQTRQSWPWTLKEPAALPHQLPPGWNPQSSRFRWRLDFAKWKANHQCGKPLRTYFKHFVKFGISFFLAETFLTASHLSLGDRSSHWLMLALGPSVRGLVHSCCH